MYKTKNPDWAINFRRYVRMMLRRKPKMRRERFYLYGDKIGRCNLGKET